MHGRCQFFTMTVDNLQIEMNLADFLRKSRQYRFNTFRRKQIVRVEEKYNVARADTEAVI